MPKLVHEKSRRIVDVPAAKVGYYRPKGWAVDVVVSEQESEHELVFPDPEKANHDTIDEFAREHEVTFEGIDAKDAGKPTKAEKVEHLQKVIAERDAAASA